MDESNDINDTAQLFIFIRGINDSFRIIKGAQKIPGQGERGQPGARGDFPTLHILPGSTV